MIKHAIAIAAALSLTACAVVPTPTTTDMANANFGTPMTQDQAEGIAHTFFNSLLKDPYSAHIGCARFQPGWMKDSSAFAKEVTYGYRLDCAVNAKNSYGGYTGDKIYKFLFRDNKLVYAYIVTDGGMERVL